MNQTIENFLSGINSLHQLEPENLPIDVVEVMIKMKPEELYKICTQFVVLRHNVPTQDKMINIAEDELVFLVDNYAKDLLKRIRG